jgi:serine phosphatase RsbU (regulator of sigma subunit)
VTEPAEKAARRPDRYLLTQRAMFEAPAHALIDSLVRALREHYGVLAAELLLADYELNMLCPVLGTAEPTPVTGSPAGQVLVGRRAIVTEGPEGVRLLLPAAARGDAVGVLVLDLARRPEPPTIDELLSLATALGHDIRAADSATDRYRAARRRTALTVAAEMQWQLLPGRSACKPEFELAGQLEPAYSVCGDNFDWATEDDHLVLTVTNGHGTGIEASLLTVLAVTAMRNARLATPRISDHAALADQAIYAQHRGSRHLSTLLLRFDLASGTVAAVDAGSPMVLRLRGDDLQQVKLEAQLPLGMFESTVYVEQTFRAEPGDRLIVLSDGVHEAPYGGRRYSEHGRLRQTLVGTRRLPPAEAVRAVLADHNVFRQGTPLDDDAAIVVVDWTGR